MALASPVCSLLGLCPGKQDDVSIALQLALISCSKFWQEPRYARFRATNMDLGQNHFGINRELLG